MTALIVVVLLAQALAHLKVGRTGSATHSDDLTLFHPKTDEVVTGIQFGSAEHHRLKKAGFEQSFTRRPAQPPQFPVTPNSFAFRPKARR